MYPWGNVFRNHKPFSCFKCSFLLRFLILILKEAKLEIILYYHITLVGGFNPSEKYSSKWIIFPNFRGEHKKYLKPPPSITVIYINWICPHIQCNCSPDTKSPWVFLSQSPSKRIAFLQGVHREKIPSILSLQWAASRQKWVEKMLDFWTHEFYMKNTQKWHFFNCLVHRDRYNGML